MNEQRVREVTVAEETYRQRGFRHECGFGSNPALLHIDLANAWTRPGSAFTCEGVEPILEKVASLNETARAAGVPVLYTTTAYDHPAEAGNWLRKIPALAELQAGSKVIEIDDRVAPHAADVVIVKKRASAFPGTELETLLRRMSIDTLIITGLTASCCVRHTAEDSIAAGYRTIVVGDAVGDRIPGAVEYNLFDIGSKFADVVAAHEVDAYLKGLGQTGKQHTTHLVSEGAN